MKFRFVFVILTALALSACNFSLAEDITPPPGYVPPTPPPDVGILYPLQPPSPARGAEEFAGNCAPCHGAAGLGNGPMSSRMPVAVPAIGLRDISSQAAPADWYKVVSLGNRERGMPPFITHPSQERWDTLAYTYMLSTSPEELQHGADLFSVNCAECHGPGGSASLQVDFTDQPFMTQVTDLNLYRAIAEGRGMMPGFDGQFSRDDIWALTAYVRSLSFDMSTLPAATPETAATPVPTEAETPVTEQDNTPAVEAAETPVAPSTVEAVETPAPTTLQVDGTVANASGAPLEAGLVAMLNIYDMAAAQVTLALKANVSADGSFHFADVPAGLQKAYWVSVEYQGVSYFSMVDAYDGSVTSMDLPVTVYDITTDWTTLDLDLLHIVLDFSTPGVVKVSELYSLYNLTAQTVVLETDGTSLPFVELPAGAADLTLQPSSNSASFLPAGNGIALPPLQEEQYGVVASFTLPYQRRLEFSQNIPLPVSSVTLFAADGTTIKSSQLTDGGTQTFGSTLYRIFQGANLPAGALTFTVTAPPGTQNTTVISQRTGLVIGVAVLGAAFISLGVFLFLRDRSRARQEELEEAEVGEEDDAPGNNRDAITDAIIALDEQVKNGEISREAYEKRRAELKERLKQAL